MRFKKAMLIMIVLLAVLTIGAVNAADNVDLNDTLTAENIRETVDVSPNDYYLEEMGDEDVSIEVRNIDSGDSGAVFADVYLPEKDGNFVICKGEDDETLELYREDISASDKVDEDEGMFHLGISLDDVNAFISGNINDEYNFYDVVAPGDVLRFVLEYNGEDLAIRSYNVEIDENDIFFEAEENMVALVEVYTHNVINDTIYKDTQGYIFEISPPKEFEWGRAEIIVNGISKFDTRLSYHDDMDDWHYYWNLKTLGMSETGEYNITIRIMTEDSEESYNYTFNVVEFKNDTFRAKWGYNEGIDTVMFFCPDGASGTVTLNLIEWDDDDNNIPAGQYTYEINSTMYNKWTVLSVLDEVGVDSITVGNDEIYVEWEDALNDDEFSFDVNDWDNIYEDGFVACLLVPFSQTESNFTFTIRSGENELYSVKISELQGRDYEWRCFYGCRGGYLYYITVDDVNSLDLLCDKDEVLFNLSGPGAMIYSSIPYMVCHVQKEDDFMRFHGYDSIRIDMVEFSLEGLGEEEDEQVLFNISEGNVTVIKIGVPDELNITETAIVRIAYADKVYTKNLKDFESEYQYSYMGNVYRILLSDLNPENLKNRDLISISLLNGEEVIGNRTILAYVNDEGLVGLNEFIDSVGLEFHFGKIGHSEFGMSNSDGKLMILTLPDYLNITDGTIQLISDNGEVLFSKSLSEFDENCTSHDGIQSREYAIFDDVSLFDYSCIPDGTNFTASFSYDNTTLSFERGVRIGDFLYHINTPVDISKLFKVSVSEGILCDGGENAIIIEATKHANPQSIGIDLGGGYFVVYVNGNKIENLGKLIGFGNETELTVFRLCSKSFGITKLYVYLADINITENGIYSIRVTHVSEGDGDLHMAVETELFNKNITLTSNVKVNYQNSTVQLFTGYGFNPVLLYLDTYYDDISATNGTITVINSKGIQILSKDIRNLSYDNGRYYLSYSDFENTDFGDNITVRYSNGNERNGETTLDVMWKDVESDDFTPAVISDVDDYYGNFVNMNIPALINTGQIIVTLKFKNNHGSNISNMNVTTDFDSQAVYTFNVADIKANSEDGDLNLALSDLGFYEINGDYEIDVRFTADGTDTLDVTSNNVKVEFLDEILLEINETSRYANALPFAGVKVFEPVAAYAELYIDGVLYSHKTFEKGFIRFESSPIWNAGNHTAELIVFDSEFASVLNSTAVTFETLVGTDDVEVALDDTVKEGENVYLNISVPKASEAVIQIDGSAKNSYSLQKGDNVVDLGVMDYGNHTVFVAYNTTLDDGSDSYYTNYLTMFVGDDGSWMDLPEPLVLNDDDTVRFAFGEDVGGNVSVVIDGVEVANMPLVNGSGEVNLTELITGENRYGRHTYNITYTGDAAHDSLSKAGEFEVTYLFKDNLVKEGFPLMENYEVAVTLPGDAQGNVTLLVEGKSYTSALSKGRATFKLDNLAMGEHNVTLSYSGDDKYPSSSYTNVLNVSYYGVIGDFTDSKRIVSLYLPANATGYLTVYNDNMAAKLFSVPLSNGKASADLSDLTVGKYELRAVYEGNDYDVRLFTAEFDVLPQIYISQNVTVGETAQILVDLDNSTGHLLVLIEGISPQLIEIENGIVNYTFSTEGLSKGNHTVSFQYFGNSFDKNIFYAVNRQTGYPMPINFNLGLLPKSPQLNMTPGDDWVIVDCGNATGTIEVFVNGVSAGVVDIVNGIATIDLSGFKNGNYNITFRYSGDRIYDEFTRNMTVDVVHKVATIKAKNVNVVYSAKGKYSVTVYDKEGNAAAGVKVTFVIGSKTYKTATTNSKGVASIVIGKNPGRYKITSKALGVSSAKTLIVKHLVTLKKVTVKRSAKKLTLTATLGKVNKKYLKNKKVTFKLNGKKFTAKTNSKGVAKVTVTSSVLQKLKAGKKVTYQATYLKDTVKRSVKVKK